MLFKRKPKPVDSTTETSPAPTAPTAPTTPAASDPPPKKSPLPKFISYGAILVVMLAASYYLQKSLFFGSQAAESKEPHEPPEQKEEKGDKEEAEDAIVMLDELIVNPADTGGRRYLAVTVGLQVHKKEQESEIEKGSVLIRDALITLLSSKHIDELSNTAFRDSLRTEIRDAVNRQLKSKPVKRVVFSSYVLQ